MAHGIEGRKVFVVGAPAWHEVGYRLDDAPTVEEAWRLAYPHNIFSGWLSYGITVNGEQSNPMPVETHKSVVRDDGILLGIVGADREIFQPYEAFHFFEPYLETGKVSLEAGGSLKGGRIMWALAKIEGSETEVLRDDVVQSYYLLTTSFDGSTSLGMLPTSVRVVCNNTLSWAMQAGKGKGFRYKHTKNVRIKVETARAEIESLIKHTRESSDILAKLASHRMSRHEQERYIANLFITPEEQQKEKVSTKKINKVNRIIDLLEDQRGLDLLPAVRGTAWQAYNAVTEYLTHEHGRSDDSRLQSAWLGESATVNAKALQSAIALTQ